MSNSSEMLCKFLVDWDRPLAGVDVANVCASVRVRKDDLRLTLSFVSVSVSPKNLKLFVGGGCESLGESSLTVSFVVWNNISIVHV